MEQLRVDNTPQVSQLVIEPPDDDEDDDEEEEEKQAVEPFERYFHWKSIFLIISSLLVSGFFIFEPQLIVYFWKIYAPDETPEYLLNLKSCKVPSLYDGQSELPFMWDLDISRSGNLDRVDFGCGSVDQFSDVDDDEKLYLLAKLKRRKCCFRNITRPDTMDNDMYRVSNICTEFTTNGTDITGSEFLLIQCIHTRNKSVDFNTHALIPSKPSVVEKVLHWNSKYNKDDDLPYSVAIIVIASTSRANAFRSLPQTMEYLEGADANFVTMNGYQGMEENTPSVALTFSNILPLISGIQDPTSVKWVNRWDNYSMLWNKFSDEKYVTMFMDDSKKMLRTSHGNSVGNGKHKAFKKQPTDYYLKPFLEAHSEAADALYSNRPVAKRYCMGKMTITAYLLKHLIRFHNKFEMIPTFSFSFLSWPQQQFGLEALSKMDGTYLEFFKGFLSMPRIKDNTVVIVMSDHGSVNHPYFRTKHGSLEKLNPLLMIRLPRKLVEKHPKYMDNLKVNSHRVVSPLDVHRTISIFPKIFTEKNDTNSSTVGTGTNTPNNIFPVNQGKLLGKNLFVSEIPYDRSCEDAFIPEAMCLCNKSSPSSYNGRSIVTENGMPEKYWHYTSLPE